MEDDGFERLIHGLRTGDGVVLSEFMDRYRPALERVAARRIQPGLRRRVGPETVAQSVCRTFLRRVGKGDYELADGAALWRLLCAIALTKVREKARYHRRHKRSADREARLDLCDGLEAAGPGPEDAVAFAEQLELQIAAFSGEERLVFDLRLQDRRQSEIAETLGVSERTVRRLLRSLEERLRAALERG